MKLYRAKIPLIAHDTIKALSESGDIEVEPEKRSEAEADLVAIMEEFLRRDSDLRARAKDYIARRKLPYSEYGKVRKQLADEQEHPFGEDVVKFFCRQFIENLLISPFVEEVYADDAILLRRIREILYRHDVDEEQIRTEAIGRIKNVKEGTVEYELALSEAMREIKKRKGLFG
ncbi:MAG: DUF507 family protein [Deltaproteobacteria bacterium]|nr:MAG: DUF507 family protein [Deltaproteobacteria bacterium]